MIDNSHERINVDERIKQQSYSLALKPPWDPRTSQFVPWLIALWPARLTPLFFSPHRFLIRTWKRPIFIDRPWSSPLNHYDVGQVSPGR
jgi:hypothetical protein